MFSNKFLNAIGASSIRYFVCVSEMSDLASYVGSTYVGDMKEGRFHGQGVFTYPTGVRYEGGFDNNQFHGDGLLIFSDSGAVYTACWNQVKFTVLVAPI